VPLAQQANHIGMIATSVEDPVKAPHVERGALTSISCCSATLPRFSQAEGAVDDHGIVRRAA
jgi:hypothetical protein